MPPKLLNELSLGVIGLGQIGGSIVRRLARYRPGITLYATDRDNILAGRARRYARWRPSLREVVHESDILILAVPVPAIVELLGEIAECAPTRPKRKRLIVFDTGTVKHMIVRAAQRYRKAYDFVGLHPLAGTEMSGWKGSRADLFTGRKIVHCPGPVARTNRIARELICLLGGAPLRLDPVEHDRFTALAIGLPHLLAFAASALVAEGQKRNPLLGGSWDSLTRVAASDPDMIAGFLQGNHKLQAAALRKLRSQLDLILDRLGDDGGHRLSRHLSASREGKRHGS